MLERYLFRREEGSLQDVKWKYVLKYLRTKNVISSSEETRLLSLQSKIEVDWEVVKLLDAKKAEKDLIQALNATGYDWLGKELQLFIQTDVNTQKKLKIGSVPFETAHEMVRTEKKSELRKALEIAATAPYRRWWVVLHGMMGSGKTTLAAQTVRDFSVCVDLFPGDIFWVTFGKTEKDNLLLKVQGLCDQLDPRYHPENLDRCQMFLRNKFHGRQDVLLVLDDVQSEDVIHFMDIGVPILVTTRNLNIMPIRLVAGKFETVSVGEGFTLAQSRTLMSQYLKIPDKDLPSCCDEIHTKYQGCPLVIALVSGHMLDYSNPTEKHWQSVWQKLQNRQLQNIKHSSEIDLKEAVGWAVDSLGLKLKERFLDFALFWEDVCIPQPVFEMLWDLDEMDTERIMHALEKCSLVRRQENIINLSGSSGGMRVHSYVVHDLLLDYIKEITIANKSKHHARLVDSYLDTWCKPLSDGSYNYGRLPRDGYIYSFLGYHLSRSEKTELFPIIYLDLRFLQVKLEESGLYDVLFDFRNYRQYFRKEYKKDLEDFELFIRQNGSQLSTGSEDSATFDLVQLALMENPTSAVYKAALRILPQMLTRRKNPRKYYRWCNQSNVRSNLRLSVRPHGPQCAVNYVSFSPNGCLVASTGQDKKLRLWDSTLGKEVVQYKEHESSANACCFSACGKLLMSASDGGELEVWEVPEYQKFFPADFQNEEKSPDIEVPATPKTGGRKFSYALSNSPSMSLSSNRVNPKMTLEDSCKDLSVTACAFSPTKDRDQLLAASGYDNGIVKVWSISKEDCLKTLERHKARITSVGFSTERRRLASSSRDSKVIVWDLDTWNCLYTLEHDQLAVVSCQLCRSGDRLLSAAGKYVWQWNLTSDDPQPKKYDGLKSKFLLTHCSYSPDENCIAGGTSDRSVVIWSSETGEVLATFKGLAEHITCVSFSPDGSKLVSSSNNGNVLLWDLPSYNHDHCLPNSKSCSRPVSLTTNASVTFLQEQGSILPKVVASDDSNRVQLISGLEGKLCFRSHKEKENISACALSPSGDCIIYATEGGSLKVCQIKNDNSGDFISLPTETSSKISICAFSLNGQWFVSCHENGTILVWPADSHASTAPKKLNYHRDDIVYCRMYNSGMKSGMIACSKDGFMTVWILDTVEQVTCVSHNKETVTCGDIHPERQLLASSSVDKTLKIWNVVDGKNKHDFQFDHCVRSCRLNPSGRLVAGGDDSGIIYVYDMDTETRLQCLQNHATFVNDLHFSPDSHRLVSAGDGLRWWNLNPSGSSNPQQAISFHGGEIFSLFVSPDFSVFVMVDNNGCLLVLKELSETSLKSLDC